MTDPFNGERAVATSWRYGLPLASPSSPVDTTRVTTMLTADERLRVDAVGMGVIQAYHRDSVEDVWRDLREHRARALIVSTAMCQRADIGRMARVVREFPRIPAVALLSQFDNRAARTVLTLGQCGVRTLIDVREPLGWRELRSVLLSERASDIQRLAVAQLSVDLATAPAGALRFFEALFSAAPRTLTIRRLARALGMIPSTLMSRFFRAKLPPVKRYLALARLTYAARLFENPGISIANVANQLDYSSPQSFSRHVRSILGLTAVEFRARYDGEGMLQHFRDDLVLSHRERWRTFDPLVSGRIVARRSPNVANVANAVGAVHAERPQATAFGDRVARVADGG